MKTDLLVVGGGVIGLATAYEAARAGLSVVVVERERAGAGATAVAAGMLAPGSEVEGADERLLAFSRESARLWPDFAAALEHETGRSCRHRREGTLLVALGRDHEVELQRLGDLQQRSGQDVTWLSAAELRAREPQLSPRVSAGFCLSGDHQVDPRAVAEALAAALVARGAVLRIGTVTACEPGLVEVTGAGERARFEPRHVVLAAGAWTNEALPGLKPLPLRPVKGQILRLRGGALVRHVVRTPDVYLVPREGGELVVGATVEEQGFDAEPRAGAVLELLREAFRVLPGVAELALAGVDVGFRPALRDHLPAIGPWGHVYVATGHFRNGVLLAPATARLLVEALVSGRWPEALLPFAPARFAEEAPR